MLEKIIIISLIVLAINSTMWEGNIFSFVRRFGDKHFPVWLQKIVYDCYICCVPYYGIPIYFLLPYLPQWLVIILCAMGLNACIYLFSNKD